ncbi:MAG: hypothetical protein COB53_06415 [Elusimicrobia bacterium]|nr:MAG: hypothetical protein COB53_06415 [Elusimicrobiota bacterium]
MSRKIPASGINLFQLIYQFLAEYEKNSGQKALNLSLGNPDTVPTSAILELQGRFAADPTFEYHTYAEDNNLNGFAERMVELHGRIRVEDYPHLRVQPIPGIKTAGALVPLACGLHLPDRSNRDSFKIVSNLPAYDVIGTWGESYLGSERIAWPLVTGDGMRLNLDRLDKALKEKGLDRVDLVYVIRPGNPAAVGSSAGEWKRLIEWCIAKDVRLVNDGAYAGLCTPEQHTSLAEVAKDYEELEWLEMFSVSKSYSDPGARLGAVVGSNDFVADLVLVKGNTESGPVPHVMAAYGEFFKDGAAAKAALDDTRILYEKRVEYVVGKFKETGLQQACETSAGFFTLWKVPKKAFGKEVGEPAHEAFNRLVIEETGIVGVHFRGPGANGEGESFIRYAVCDDVLSPEFQKRFEEGLKRMAPEY